jgi:Family of unknown function (DUF6526)
MADATQNYQNHARLYPLFHFVAVPILLINFLYSAWRLFQTPGAAAGWSVVFAFGLLALALSARIMALTVQDRVIRLEMQLRLSRILPPELQSRIGILTPAHFVALRFASDDELPVLVRDVIDGRLQTKKDIKMRVKNWQSDSLRA